MPARRAALAALTVLMVALPVASLLWLGARSASYEQERVRLRLEEAASSVLDGIDRLLAARIQAVERELDAALDDLPEDAAELRRIGRTHRLIRQVFLLDAAGELLYPRSDAAELGTRERDFLERTKGIWEQGLPGVGASEPDRRGEGGPGGAGAWQSSLWGSGAVYLYWRSERGRGSRGAEVEGAALIADLIAALPDTAIESGADSRIIFSARDGETLYEWGSYLPDPAEVPLTTRHLGGPLAGSTLAYHAPAALRAGGASASTLGLLSGIAALGLVLAGVAIVIWREGARDAREALRRVSFVNQVSHELKTPLTNIRMYAELLQERLRKTGASGAAEDPEARAAMEAHAAVIVDESRRLSRLILNVLSFSRRDRGALEVRRSPDVVDVVVGSVIEDFRPRLEQRGISVTVRRGAAAEVWVDADALEQILANLIGNVEKYAAEGGYLRVETRGLGGRTEIRVTDHGPGVPPSLGDRIFEPFVRSSDRLTDGVAGTGIGLTIARELARLHGGDVVIGESDAEGGACFVVTLETPACEEGT